MARPSTSGASRGLVLDTVRAHAPISRVELAERTGLTQATISTVVRALLDDGLLVETDQREYTGGKPRVKLVLNPRSRCAVGVQLGADWLVVVLTDATGAVLARTRTRGARDDEPSAVVARAARHVQTLLEAAGVPRSDVVGLGLAAPGTLDLDAGVILASRSLERWHGVPVRSAFADATGLRVHLDNDATSAAVGEYWGGQVGPSTAHCTVYMGAGIGAGIVIHGSVYRGASSNTGPLGQLRVNRDRLAAGPSVEELAAPRAVAARARAAVQAGRSTLVQLSEDGDPFADFAAVATAAVLGDPLAGALIEESAEHLADAVVVMADLLDLDSLVLAGPSFTTAGAVYLTTLRRRLAAELFAGPKHGVRVTLSTQVADAAAAGAAALVLQNELAPR